MFFYKSEIRPLLVTLLLVALAFGFNDGRETFEWALWSQNFLAVTIASLVVIGCMVLGYKLMARRYGFGAEFTISYLKRYWFGPYDTFPKKFLGFKIPRLPLGAILSVLFTLVSNGKFPFVAISSYNLVYEKASRFGRKYVHVTDIEEAKIALSGPILNMLLVLILSFFNGSGTFDMFILISAAFVLYHMIPVFDFPGTKIFFGSRLLYVFSLVFMIAFYGSIFFLHPILTLVLSLIFAAIILVVFYYFNFYR